MPLSLSLLFSIFTLYFVVHTATFTRIQLLAGLHPKEEGTPLQKVTEAGKQAACSQSIWKEANFLET